MEISPSEFTRGDDMKEMKEILVDNSEAKTAEALAMADEFIGRQELDKKKAIRLRLLAEEALGMMKAMTGEFQAKFQMEADDGEYRIHLAVETNMSLDKKNDLLSMSKSGKNAAVKGFMGKLGEIIENSLLNFDEVMELQQEYGTGCVDYAFMGMGMPGEIPMEIAIERQAFTWSLRNYREGLEGSEQKPAREAWDELEKSIVANIAKDVIVGVKKNHVDMTIVM